MMRNIERYHAIVPKHSDLLTLVYIIIDNGANTSCDEFMMIFFMMIVLMMMAVMMMFVMMMMIVWRAALQH